MDQKFITFLCCVIILLFAMALTIVGPLLTNISTTFSLSLSQSGLLFTANFIGFVIFILFGGVLSEYWGKKTILSVSLVGFTFTLLLFPLSPTFYWACGAMFLMGGFGGIIESMISALISEVNIENASFYVNLSQVFFGVGALIGPMTAGIIISSNLGWQLLYYVLFIFSFILSVLFLFAKVPSRPNQSSRISWSGFKSLIKDIRFLGICLCMMLYTGSEVGGWGWMATFLKENMNFSSAKSGLAVGIFWLGMTLGRLVCGQLSLKYSIRSIIIVLSISAAIFTLTSGVIHDEISVWFIIFLMGLTYSSQWPLIVAYGSALFNTSSGTVFALLVGSGGLGTTFIPYLMGLIGERVNIKIAMMSPAILFIVIFMFFLRINSKPERA